MRLALLITSALAETCCATMDSNPNGFERMSWADTDEVMGAIACAVELEFGASRAEEILDVEIYVRADYALNGLYQPPRSIYLEASFPNAQVSPLRHEFTHRILHVVEDDTHPNHDPVFIAQYDRLNLNMAACRSAALKKKVTKLNPYLQQRLKMARRNEHEITTNVRRMRSDLARAEHLLGEVQLQILELETEIEKLAAEVVAAHGAPMVPT